MPSGRLLCSSDAGPATSAERRSPVTAQSPVALELQATTSVSHGRCAVCDHSMRHALTTKGDPHTWGVLVARWVSLLSAVRALGPRRASRIDMWPAAVDR